MIKQTCFQFVGKFKKKKNFILSQSTSSCFNSKWKNTAFLPGYLTPS